MPKKLGNNYLPQQAVQTNPQTGVRQIIAIPINAVQAASSSSAAGVGGSGNVSIFTTAGGAGQQRINVSPMKVRTGTPKWSYESSILLSALLLIHDQITQVKTTTNSTVVGAGQQQVRVVKLASAGSVVTSKAALAGSTVQVGGGGNTVQVTSAGGFQHAQVIVQVGPLGSGYYI